MPTESDEGSRKKSSNDCPDDCGCHLRDALLTTLEKYPLVERDLYQLLTERTPGPGEGLVILAAVANRILIESDLNPKTFEQLLGMLQKITDKIMVSFTGEMPRA
jgi:hypothetical protein